MAGIEIPFEIADGITLAVMKEHLQHLREECRAHLEEGRRGDAEASDEGAAGEVESASGDGERVPWPAGLLA